VTTAAQRPGRKKVAGNSLKYLLF
jgi:hypothetical protein